MKGTTDNYLPVRFEAGSDTVNRLLTVRMERIADGMMEGFVMGNHRNLGA